MLIQAPRVLFPDEPEPKPGWIETSGGVIVAAAPGVPPRPADETLEATIAPGYVDVHAHGGGGASFVTTDPADVSTVLDAHMRNGTTTMVASLVTGEIDALVDQIGCLVEFCRAGKLGGIHLEGPWLAPEYKGAHPVDLLVDPAEADVDRLLEAGQGYVRMVTIAPERAGAMAAITRFAEAGVVAAIGHTNASFDAVREAIDAGATGATHLFNGMPPMLHRTPGPVLALWQDPRVWVEIIFDGVHSRLEMAAFVMEAAPGRVVFITDAMGAAGAPDGDYILGTLPVSVRDRVARIAGTDTIAGSTLTLDLAVRNAVATGVSLAEAVAASTSRAADYLGLSDVGRVKAGARADLVVLDDALFVTRVMRDGAWI